MWKAILSYLRSSPDSFAAAGTPGAHLADPPQSGDGSIEIHGDEVRVTEPRGRGKWPVLIPGPGVEVQVDGQPITGPVVLSASQKVTFRLPEPAAAMRRFAVTIDPDAMVARLELGPLVTSAWDLAERGPAQVLTLRAIPRPFTLTNPTREQVLAALQAAGVVRGIDREAIDLALQEADPCETIIARGDPGTPTRHGEIETLWNPAVAEAHLIMVDPGTVLAIAHPPVPGQPGWDLLGREITPEPPRTVRLATGPGAVLSPDGRQAIALVQGRPSAATGADGTVTVSVQPLFIHPGNVTRDTGDVDQDCDVIIRGWVEATTRVRSGGHLEIEGGVQGADLEAQGRIVVCGGCIRSRVRQGGAAAVLPRLEGPVAELLGLLTQIQHTAAMALAHPRYARVPQGNPVGPLVQLLVTHRFSRAPAILQELKELALAHPATSQFELGGLCTRLEAALVEGSAQSLAELDHLAGQLRFVQGVLQEAAPRAANRDPVRLYYLLLSEIYATGDVEVFGPGAEQSAIHAVGRVTILGHVRGGRIEAGGDVQVNQVGTPAGIHTAVAVPPGCTVQARRVYPNVHVNLGTRSHRFTEETRDVVVSLNEAGEIAIRRLRPASE